MRRKRNANQVRTGLSRPITHNVHIQNPRAGRSTTTNNNNNNNDTYNAGSSSKPLLTLSDAYKGNLLLYNFLSKHSQKVFLERNITRVLSDQARLLKAENEGRKGGRKYWNRDGGSREMSEIVRRLGVVPNFDDDMKFGLKVESVRGLPRDWFDGARLRMCECELTLFAISFQKQSSRYHSRLGLEREEPTKSELLSKTAKIVSQHDPENPDDQVFCAKRPLVIPLSIFGIEDSGGGRRLASSGYEIRFRIRLRRVDEDISETDCYEAYLRLDGNLVYSDSSNETVLTAVKLGESDCESEDLQLKVDLRWSKSSIDYHILKPESTDKTVSSTSLPPKRRKLIVIDHVFHGHVKNFDEQDSHKKAYASTVNLNKKLYVFNHQGHAFTCVICQNNTFQTLDRLRFHLMHTHMYFSFSVEEYNPGKNKEYLKIVVEPAVEENKRSQRPGNNDRKFTWVRHKGLGERALNLQDYLRGDTTWARGTAVPELERKLMNAPGRMLKKMQIVPDLVFTVEKRRCVAATREDGKGYVRFHTRGTISAGDEVSESDDDIDEEWADKKIAKRIETSGFSAAGQEFLKMWASHVMVEKPQKSDQQLHDCLIRFCRQNKKTLKSAPFRQEFDKFMTALKTRGQVDKALMKECKKVLDLTP